ncbi:MAG: futalosine hydrolase [Phycisphaerales bacterium]|nr:futalosine hydrolase [Phycisphaerales bacterium]
MESEQPDIKTNDEISKRWLLAVAAPREVNAVLSAFDKHVIVIPKHWARCELNDRFDLVHTGVGKSNAAGAVAKVLDPERHIGVLSIGIAGSLPQSQSNDKVRCDIGDVICASESVFADDGVQTPNEFVSCSEMGFSIFGDGTDRCVHAQETIEWLKSFSDHVGSIACVSICSGTNERASQVFKTTGAICEAMEGAAVSLAAKRIDPVIRSAELRVISNTTGDRTEQEWDLEGALNKLEDVLGRLNKQQR